MRRWAQYFIFFTVALSARETNVSLDIAYPFLKELTFQDEGEKTGIKIEIETQRLLLRTVEKEDYSFYLECFQNDEIRQLYGSGHMRESQHQQAFKSLLERGRKGDPSNFYSIRMKNKGSVIGFVALLYGSYTKNGFPRNSQAEIAIALFKENRKQRYGTEALSSLILIFTGTLREHSFRFKEEFMPSSLQTLWAMVLSGNIAAQKFLEKLEFETSESGEGQIIYRTKFPDKEKQSELKEIMLAS